MLIFEGEMEIDGKIIETKTFKGLRKVYHVLASSLFPLAYLYPPFHWSLPETRKWLLLVSFVCFLISLVLDLFRLQDHQFNSWFMRIFSEFIRHTEAKKLNGSTFLCLAFLLVIFFFSRKVAITAMFFLSLGDAAAELGGKYFGRLKVWSKTLEGSAAFFLVAFLIAFTLLENWIIALVGAVAGTLVELFSFDLDDNLTVPIGSALALSLALVLFHPGNSLFFF